MNAGAPNVAVDMCAMSFVRDEQLKPCNAGSVNRHELPLVVSNEISNVEKCCVVLAARVATLWDRSDFDDSGCPSVSVREGWWDVDAWDGSGCFVEWLCLLVLICDGIRAGM